MNLKAFCAHPRKALQCRFAQDDLIPEDLDAERNAKGRCPFGLSGFWGFSGCFPSFQAWSSRRVAAKAPASWVQSFVMLHGLQGWRS